MPQKILVRAIVEMMGNPKEYIEQTLKTYIKKLKQEGLQVKKEHYEEASLHENMYSTFSELEVEFDAFEALTSFCFDAMPSTVEVLYPEKFDLSIHDFTAFLTDLQARLHEVDMIVKTQNAEQKILHDNTFAIFCNFIARMLETPKSLPELSYLMGIKDYELKPFLDRLVANDKIIFEEEKYQLVQG